MGEAFKINDLENDLGGIVVIIAPASSTRYVCSALFRQLLQLCPLRSVRGRQAETGRIKKNRPRTFDNNGGGEYLGSGLVTPTEPKESTMKKIITMILTVVALLTVLPAFADIGAVAPISSVPMSIVAKAPDVTMVPAAATGNPS